jgi:GH24 family phage-related lysozyme (muramidase)
MALIALLGVNTAIVSLLFNAGNTHTISTILKELKVQKSVLVSVT